MVEKANAAGRAGGQLRPADRRAPNSPRTSRSTTNGSASCRPKRWSKKLKEDGNASGPIVDDQRRPDGQQRRTCSRQARTAVFDAGRRRRRQGVRHPGLAAENAQTRDAAGDHRARQRRVRRASTPPTTAPRGGAIAALKGGRHRPRRPSGHRPGRELAGHPADPRRPAVHDDLQGRSSRRPRSPPSSRWRWRRARTAGRTRSSTRRQQRQGRRPVGDPGHRSP